MKENLLNVRLRFLRMLMLFIALSLCFGNLFAQLSVTTTVPTGQSEALNVGVGTAIFSTIITNTGSSTTHINSLALIQPAGVSIVSATANIVIAQRTIYS